ncbi:MAG: glycosyltransferase family 1 protein [Candidatus Binataceae bacterium]|jgi:glycosyltransferase involved in cell wall biosynthesis
MTPGVVVNTRSIGSLLSGVQRYTIELQHYLSDLTRPIAPRQLLGGIAGHAWEQFALPRFAGRQLLWSPANTGPLSVKHQVLTIHDVASLDHPEWFNARFAAWYRWLIPRLVCSVHHIITVSEFSRQRLIEVARVREDHLSVVPNGVNSRFFSSSYEEAERVRLNMRIPSPSYLLGVGSFEPRKNLNRLLQAWREASEHLPSDVWLVLAGRRGLSHVFRDAGFAIPARTYLAGFVPDSDLPGLYRGALAFVYPSLYEGFGLPVLEAMAAGNAVITSNNTAMPEIVEGAGLMVDPYDVGAIGDAIIRIVEDPALRINLRSRAPLRARNYSWSRSAAATRSILESAMRQ